MYRKSIDTPRCEFCGGSDVHTAGCWSQRDKGRPTGVAEPRKPDKK